MFSLSKGSIMFDVEKWIEDVMASFEAKKGVTLSEEDREILTLVTEPLVVKEDSPYLTKEEIIKINSLFEDLRKIFLEEKEVEVEFSLEDEGAFINHGWSTSFRASDVHWFPPKREWIIIVGYGEEI